jgi:hypothetical protein
MAAELGKFISEWLITAPANHPEKKYMEIKLAEAEERESLKSVQPLNAQIQEVSKKELSVEEAKKRLNDLIKEDIIKSGLPTENTRLRRISYCNRWQNKENLGNQSIFTLISVDVGKIAFSALRLLHRNNIIDKRQLSNMPWREIKSLRDVGEKKGRFIEAMRDVVVAETKVSKNPQI